MLTGLAPGRADRIATVRAEGYPAYTTSAGWLGYSDDKVRRRLQAALADGWRRFKIKVGVDLADDIRRCEVIREEIGDRPLMADANQAWDVDEAIEWMSQLAPFELAWIEEPTSPDDILGHAAIAARRGADRGRYRRARANRVIFKQLLQAEAIDYAQIDACRLGGVNEVLAVLLLAAKFGVPSARTPAASGSASTSSTCRVSTTSPSPAASRAA